MRPFAANTVAICFYSYTARHRDDALSTFLHRSVLPMPLNSFFPIHFPSQVLPVPFPFSHCVSTPAFSLPVHAFPSCASFFPLPSSIHSAPLLQVVLYIGLPTNRRNIVITDSCSAYAIHMHISFSSWRANRGCMSVECTYLLLFEDKFSWLLLHGTALIFLAV